MNPAEPSVGEQTSQGETTPHHDAGHAETTADDGAAHAAMTTVDGGAGSGVGAGAGYSGTNHEPTCFLSWNVYVGGQTAFYPKRLDKYLSGALRRAGDATIARTSLDYRGLPRDASFDEMSDALPDFYGASVGWIRFKNRAGVEMAYGFQCTPHGGVRYIFPMYFKDGQTQYICPVDGTEKDIPPHILDAQANPLISVVCWHPANMTYNPYLHELRKLNEEGWVPFNPKVQADILDSNVLYGDKKQTLTISLGVVNLTISKTILPPGIGCQHIGDRTHFVKLIEMTKKQYEDMLEKEKQHNIALLSDTSQLHDDCPICTELLAGTTKSVMLPCGHVFHGLCIQCSVSQMGPHCPLCRKPTSIGATGRQSNICGGR